MYVEFYKLILYFYYRLRKCISSYMECNRGFWYGLGIKNKEDKYNEFFRKTFNTTKG